MKPKLFLSLNFQRRENIQFVNFSSTISHRLYTASSVKKIAHLQSSAIINKNSLIKLNKPSIVGFDANVRSETHPMYEEELQVHILKAIKHKSIAYIYNRPLFDGSASRSAQIQRVGKGGFHDRNYRLI